MRRMERVPMSTGIGQGFEGVLVPCKLLTHPETALTNTGVRAYIPLGSFRAFFLGHHFCRMYCALRRPCAYMVLERIAIAGGGFASYSAKVITQNLRIQLSNQWNFVHHRDLGADLASSVCRDIEE